jgi:hypothetical protein
MATFAVDSRNNPSNMIDEASRLIVPNRTAMPAGSFAVLIRRHNDNGCLLVPPHAAFSGRRLSICGEKL